MYVLANTPYCPYCLCGDCVSNSTTCNIRIEFLKEVLYPWSLYVVSIYLLNLDSGTTANHTSGPITDDQSDESSNGLSKLELVAVIVLPIIGICILLIIASLLVWCRKRRQRAENMQYCKF